ncbi:MAG: hypothetical protein ACRDAL_02535 [Plesiomonas shigelloides]
MINYLPMAEVFNDKFDASMLKVNPECVKRSFDDGVTPHEHIAHAVKSYDSLIMSVDMLRNSGNKLVEQVKLYKSKCEDMEAIKESEMSLKCAMERIHELEAFLHHFCDNSHNVDVGGGDYTATTCEAKEMAEKLDRRVNG